MLLAGGGLLLGRQWLPAGHPSTQAALQGRRPGAAPAPAGQFTQPATEANQLPLSASARIQLVNSSSATPGDATVQVLAHTLVADPNPNVRIAAGEALYRLRTDPPARQALVQALPRQTDPNVQVTLIALLVALHDQQAVAPLQQLTRRPEVLPVVRQQAEAGLARLL